ncbi:MAG: L-glutamate gamma-semialdehyde dehydrogenase [Meiothermus sp.]|nr:L-glutamate gamma-semialdehyde dehydrogenase [Meiothermus sp.]
MLTPEPYRPEFVEPFTSPEKQAEMRKMLEFVKAHLGHHYPLIIGGEKIDTAERLVSTNPSRPSEVVGTTAKADRGHADAALDAAWAAFSDWRKWSQEDRSRAILKAAHIMKRRQREIEAWMVLEIGKNYFEAAAETAEAIDFLVYYATQAMKYKDGAPVTHYPGEDNSAFYIPLGVGVAITPWNFPFAILAGMIVAPVVVGNTIIAKPAEDTIVLGAKLFEIFEEAGIPKGVVNFLPGVGSDIGAYLVSHPRIRFVNFTGSLEVGLRIHEDSAKAAPGQIWLKRTALELGGKNAVIVDESADLEAASLGIVQSAYGFQGQKCSAASRLIVTDGVHDALLEKVIARASKLSVGETDHNPDMGPVASAAQEATVQKYLDIGRGEGQLVLGGRRLEGSGFFFEPTIFDNVSPQARIAQEEIFGPVLSVIRVPDFHSAMEVANGTRFGLTGGVFSRRREHLEHARREFMAGNLYLNRKITGALVGVQPFGGFNLSGTDTKAGGPDYLLNFLQMKSVTERY